MSEAEENEIAVYINAFPDGWRKKFRDDGWRFVYCPSGGAYRTFKDKRGNVLYSCNYSLDEEKKELWFSKTDAVKALIYTAISFFSASLTVFAVPSALTARISPAGSGCPS